MSLTAHAAGLLADSADILSQAADADLLNTACCEDVLRALEQTIASLHHTLTRLEDSLPGRVTHCREVLAQLENLSVLLKQEPHFALSTSTPTPAK